MMISFVQLMFIRHYLSFSRKFHNICQITHTYGIFRTADDKTIKLWDYSSDFKQIGVFRGHSHYVMSAKFNPKDNETFASVSLDRTIKIWNYANIANEFEVNAAVDTLEGHLRGINCFVYHPKENWIISGADDYSIKVWNLATNICISTLYGHTGNVSSLVFSSIHGNDWIVSGAEDHTIRLWLVNTSDGTYTRFGPIDSGLERIWTVATDSSTGNIAIGCDNGTLMYSFSRLQVDVFQQDTNPIVEPELPPATILPVTSVAEPQLTEETSNV
jgi:coatomer subunit beta'